MHGIDIESDDTTTMETNKILFITQEITPFVPKSEIATVGRELPQATQERGKQIRIFTPKWGPINERRNQLHEVQRLTGMNLIIDETDHPMIIKVASLQSARMQVYFIDNDDYFQNRLMTEDENGNEYSDNDERAIFFARGVLETVKKFSWCPDVIHCHGWISSLVPLYIKSAYREEPSFRESKVVFSLYNCDFKSPLDESLVKKLLCKDMDASLVEEVKTPITYEELTKLAIRYSDGIVLNSPDIPEALVSYAKELGKEVLPYQSGEEYVSACNEFYEKF